MNKYIKRIWMALAILIISLAIISSLFRALTPLAREYKPQVEQYLSKLLGQNVRINTMETGWYWFEPVIKLNQIELLDSNKSMIRLDHLIIGINLLHSLSQWHIQPDLLLINDLHLNLHQTKEGWQIDGLDNQQTKPVDIAAIKPVLSWVLTQQKIIVKKISLRVFLLDGSTIPFTDLNLTLLHNANQIQIKSNVYLNQQTSTQLELLADLALHDDHLAQTSGHVYLSIRHLLPEQWKTFFSKSRFQLKGGMGSFQLWADFSNAKLANAQGKISVHNMSIIDTHQKKSQFIPVLNANLAWNPLNDGWQFSADHIELSLNDATWPDNVVLLRYQQDKQEYFVYVKNILIDSLVATPFLWPSKLSTLLVKKPHGELHDTQLSFIRGELQSVLTQFSSLGWSSSPNSPGINNLDGVLHWQPNEGHLEIDSHRFTFIPRKQAPLVFSTVNAVMGWKNSDHGLTVHLDRLVLNHPNLLLKAEGVADQVSSKSLGFLRLKAQFFAKNAEKWVHEIPPNQLKPKLYQWLNANIKHIDKLSGELIINGEMSEFPFDTHQGIFSIKSYVSGLDLTFSPKWPVTQHIDSYLNVDKRTLDANITQAKIQDMTLEKANLKINNMGSDREVLLIHTEADVNASSALSYLKQSPLKKKFAKLNHVDIRGPLKLDLQFEIPLYLDDSKILTLGTIHFNNNHASIDSGLSTIDLSKLNGTIQFNQKGIVGGQLATTLWGNPATLSLKSVRSPSPATEINIEGKANTSTLRNQLKSSLLSFLKGSFTFSSLIHLKDNPSEPNHMHIQTSLRGVTVNLPHPLGKKADTTASLALGLDFNADKVINVSLNYQDRLSLKAARKGKEWLIDLNEENIKATVNYRAETNTLTGVVQQLRFPQDKKNLLPDSTLSKLRPNDIPNIDLHIRALEFGDLPIGEIDIQSTSRPNKWQINALTITSPDYQVNATGHWEHQDKVNKTTLQTDMHITNLAHSLETWHITPMISAKRVDIEFHGGWPGPIYHFPLDKLNGAMKMTLKNGRITHLSPETEEKLGLGKLLSILSLQTIPRRLKLDFSDLSQQGYSFDEFSGDFTLADGVMTTDNSEMDGPVAYASIKGHLDMAKKYYDLELKVNPHITASLPIIVATIAGSPVAGMATWVASKIINQGMQKISGYTYKITGPWAQPVVEQVSIIKKTPEPNKEL